MELRPVEYQLRAGNGKTDMGFVAQDIEEVLGAYNVLGIGGDPDRTLSLRYADLMAPVVNAIQEQQATIQAQQAEIEALRATVAESDAQRAQLEAVTARLAALETVIASMRSSSPPHHRSKARGGKRLSFRGAERRSNLVTTRVSSRRRVPRHSGLRAQVLEPVDAGERGEQRRPRRRQGDRQRAAGDAPQAPPRAVRPPRPTRTRRAGWTR